MYVYDKSKGTSVDENIVSGLLKYNHDSWETKYLQQLTELSDQMTESNAPIQNCPKQLDFTDAQTAPAPSHAKTNSSGEKDETRQRNSINKGRVTQPCSQLSSALSTASTRAELAALDMLLPAVSSISSLPSSWHAQIANRQLFFIDPFSLVRRPCEAVVTAAEKLLGEEKRKGNHPSGVVINGFGQFTEEGLRTQRFGMPSQVPIDNKMIGVGSCGIGVIMAARDFIRNGPATVNNIKWRYCNMDKHRKDLMLQILKWGGHYT